MSTPLALIASALRLTGVKAAGETLTVQEKTDTLEALNSVLGSWYLEEFLQPSPTEVTFTVDGDTPNPFTLKTGGDIDQNHLLSVSEGLIAQSDNQRYDVEILTWQDWLRVNNPEDTGMPRKVYIEYEHDMTRIGLWPKPSGTYTLHLYGIPAFTPILIGGIEDELGYSLDMERAIKYELAVELAPEFEGQVNPHLTNMASSLKDRIRNKNTSPTPRQQFEASMNKRTLHLSRTPEGGL